MIFPREIHKLVENSDLNEFLTQISVDHVHRLEW